MFRHPSGIYPAAYPLTEKWSGRPFRLELGAIPPRARYLVARVQPQGHIPFAGRLNCLHMVQVDDV